GGAGCGCSEACGSSGAVAGSVTGGGPSVVTSCLLSTLYASCTPPPAGNPNTWSSWAAVPPPAAARSIANAYPMLSGENTPLFPGGSATARSRSANRPRPATAASTGAPAAGMRRLTPGTVRISMRVLTPFTVTRSRHHHRRYAGRSSRAGGSGRRSAGAGRLRGRGRRDLLQFGGAGGRVRAVPLPLLVQPDPAVGQHLGDAPAVPGEDRAVGQHHGVGELDRAVGPAQAGEGA